MLRIIPEREKNAFELYLTSFPALAGYKNVKVVDLAFIKRAARIITNKGREYGPREKGFRKYLFDGNSAVLREEIPFVNTNIPGFKQGWMIALASESEDGLAKLFARFSSNNSHPKELEGKM